MIRLIFLFLLFLKIEVAPAQLYFNFLDYPAPIIFDDLDDFVNGTETTLLFEVGSNLNRSSNSWDVLLRASDQLRMGNHQIPVQNIRVSVVNKTAGQTNPFFLNTSDRQVIKNGHINQFRKPLPVLVKLRAIGGADFMVPSGAYTTTLIFTLVED